MHYSSRRHRLLAIAFAMLGAVYVTALAARDKLHTESAVIKALHQACKAYERGDIEAMTELLTDDFTLTNSTGVVTTRADDIELIRKGAVRYEVFENKDMKARLHGDAAIVTGRTILKGPSGLNSFDAEFQFTDTLVIQDGRWKVASSHVSILKSNVVQPQVEVPR
jgi:ketosteroid isomerase-like protein